MAFGTAVMVRKVACNMGGNLGKLHLPDRHMLARLNAAIMLGLVGSGLAACALGAFVYDIGRWFSFW
jgi:hypothetical protein